MKLYKSIFAAALMAIASAGFVSCDNDLDCPPVVCPDLGGGGKWDAPLTVQGAQAYYKAYYSDVPDAGKYYWVTGYIVGCVNTTDTDFTANVRTCAFAAPFKSTSNLLMAATPDETNYENCISVQLPSGDVSNALNLNENPSNLGREVTIYGYIDKYVSVAGVKAVSRYNWGPIGENTGEVETASSEYVLAKEITSGRAYAIVANNLIAQPLETESGFLQTTSVSPLGGKFTANEKYGFLLTAAEGQDGYYYMNDYKGRFMYISKFSSGYNGYSNRPSASAAFNAAEQSYLWQPVQQEDGTWLIYNKASGAILLYDTNYNSYGIYAALADNYVAPRLYEMVNDPVSQPNFDEPEAPEVGELEGKGTIESPYTALDAINIINAGAMTNDKVYVKGKISQIKELDTGNFGNATYFISADGSKTNEFEIYRGYYYDGKKFTSSDQIKVGDEVVVYGQLIKFNTTPEMAQGNQIYSINGQTSGNTPETPDTPATGEEKGDGTEASPYNVARASAIIAAGTYTDSEVYLEGTISEIKEVSTQYGNATYYISDNGTTDGQLMVFRGNFLNGEKFTAENQIKVGDKVLIVGKLTNYKGNSPQVNQGSKIVKLNGEGSTPETPDTPDTPDTPVTGNAADFNTFNNGTANDKSYAEYTTASGWKTTWALILAGGSDATNFVSSDSKFLFPCIDGTPARPGTLTSPTIAGGLKKLTFKYGFPYNETKVGFTVNIKQSGNVVATKQIVCDPATKATVYTFSEEYSISGDFVIEIVNDCVTNASVNNKDRVAVWDLTWEN